jgi:hypothetical protein
VSTYQTIPHATWTKVDNHDLEVRQDSGATVSIYLGAEGPQFNAGESRTTWAVRLKPGDGREKEAGRIYVAPESMPEIVYVSRDVVIQLSSDAYSVTGVRAAWESLGDRDLAMALSLAELAVRRLRDEQQRRDAFGRYPVGDVAKASESPDAPQFGTARGF